MQLENVIPILKPKKIKKEYFEEKKKKKLS